MKREKNMKKREKYWAYGTKETSDNQLIAIIQNIYSPFFTCINDLFI